MASVNTNAAAITALRTLQNTNAQLDATQNRISTGLKIGEAKDNAAYWSISTTLKSDNKALSTVKDALGLGSATVDVAYQGLNKAKDVLDEIKSKLVAATQPGIDRNVIQSEISELQKQLVSIAGASVFSGENWLSVDSSATDYDATKKIVSSFSRDANNSVSIGTVDVAIGNVALFDSSTVAGKNGILDGAISLKGPDGRDLDLGTANTAGNTSRAGLTATTGAGTETGAAAGAGTAIQASGSDLGSAGGPGSPSTAVYTATGGLTLSGAMAANDTIVVTFSDGSVRTHTFAGTETTVSWAQLAGGAASGSSPTYTLGTTANTLTITESTNDGTASPTITGIALGTNANSRTISTSTPSPVATTGVASSSADEAIVRSNALTASDFAVGDTITATLNINGVNRTFTTAALTTASLADVAAKLDTAFSAYANVAVGTLTHADKLEFEAIATGAKTNFDLTALTVTGSNGVQKSITNGIGTPPSAGKHETGSFTTTTLDADDNLYFKVQVDGATAAKNVTIDQALVNKTLNVTDGKITTAENFRDVINAALAAANVTGVAASVTNTDKITFTSATTGTGSKVVISEIKASAGADTVSIDSLDISDAGLAKAGATTGDNISKVLSAYITAVNSAINKVTTAASNLGAVASRIDMQKDFVNTLMDTIDKGVGNLIDADMSEESTKLQALQVKQQLGVQALSIANQSSQNILSLFR